MSKSQVMPMFFKALKLASSLGVRSIGTKYGLFLTDAEMKQLFTLAGFNVLHARQTWMKYIDIWCEIGIAERYKGVLFLCAIVTDVELDLDEDSRMIYQRAHALARDWRTAHIESEITGWA